MLKEDLKKRVKIVDEVSDWKEAIRLVIEPLEKDGVVNDKYLSAIYDNVAENGDYFIIAPNFAMPHTRSENGALATGLSFLKLRNPIIFSSGQPVTYLMGIASKDADTHMDTLAELVDVLMEDGVFERMDQANTPEELLEILS